MTHIPLKVVRRITAYFLSLLLFAAVLTAGVPSAFAAEPADTPLPSESTEPAPLSSEEPLPSETSVLTPEPSAEPTVVPTVEPSAEPSVEPTVEPSAEPTSEPTASLPEAADMQNISELNAELSDDDYLRGISIDCGEVYGDGVWGENTEFGYRIFDSEIDLEMVNASASCALTPSCSDRDFGTYKILSGSTVVSDNAPYTVAMPSAGTQTFTVQVTAQNGNTRSYMVHITRAAAQNLARAYHIFLRNDRYDMDDFSDNEGAYTDRFSYDFFMPYSLVSLQADVYPMDMGTTYQVYRNGRLLASNEHTSIDLMVGTNKIEFVLTSETGVQTTYTYYIHRDNIESSLDLEILDVYQLASPRYGSYHGDRIEGFDKDKTAYSISLPNAAEDIVFRAVSIDYENSVIAVKKGDEVIEPGDNYSYAADLDVGENIFTFEVSSPLISYTKIYTVSVIRAAQNDANADLSNLHFSSHPADGFDAGILTYDYVDERGASINPVASDLNATYQMFKDGELISPSKWISLETESSAVVTIVVTAPNGTTKKTYTVNLHSTVSDATLNSIYAYSESSGDYINVPLQSGQYDYSLSAPYADNRIRIYLNPNNFRTSDIDVYKDSVLLAQGEENVDGMIYDLEVGSNTFVYVVTALDGVTQRTYTINITRAAEPSADNADLHDMSFYVALDDYIELFTPDQTVYDISVGNSIKEASLNFRLVDISATGRVYLNGKYTAECGDGGIYCSVNRMPLKEGANTLQVVVTAEDGVTQKTYTVNISRESSALKNMEIISLPDKLSYKRGETLNLSGLSVMANYNSGYFEMLSGSDVAVSGYNKDMPGTQTVTVTYGGCTDTFTVDVIKSVTSVSVSSHSKSVIQGDTFILTATVLPTDAVNSSVTWTSSNTVVATVDNNGKVTAKGGGSAVITATADGLSDTCNVTVAAKQPSVIYQSHVQNIGWQSQKRDGEMSGTSGRSYRLEAMRIYLDGIDGGVEYRTHVQNIGWMNWVSDGALSGTEGLAYRLEAIEIKLTGSAAEQYDIYYRVHAQNYGWLGWAKNGQSSGTAGYGYRLEAVEIKLVPKNAAAPGSTAHAFVEPHCVSYQSHVQNIGWQDWKISGEVSGTSGLSYRLEAMRIKLDGIDGGVEYRTHVQNIGWMSWVSNGALSGTSGQSYRLEAINIRLTGKAAGQYDIYYRVHAQNVGWMGWAKNGEDSGTAGFSYRLEAVQIMLVAKGEAAPGSTANAFKQK